ncbi:MAG: hypothetical protein OEX18_10220 [Candidatus Krumholzibacteria bacterium]|nr:hypothetical protein [Candidatus Krumholzibacteria bacterium]MDH4337634.1 hypothetical protein [Candidatus Krumholzibacteria bacterium]MDH5270286.1 hypothetical protein [Candidatus Krumholzibacteria bacterium]MDH5627312.1 hypothetical protein [Candidatus Krumholzibacteria bacterium]
MRYLLAPTALLLIAAACQQQPASDTPSGASLLTNATTSASDERGRHVDYDWNAIIDGNSNADDREVATGSSVGAAAAPDAAAVVTRVIDFETPSLGFAGSMVINPYVDAATGVVFTASSTQYPNAVVGLVKNSSTSACVDPANADQKLASGVGTTVGLSGFPIHANFPQPLAPPCAVSVEVQIGVNATVLLTLIHPDGTSATITQRALTRDGTCGFPGDDRSRLVISAASEQPVSKIIVGGNTAARVFVIDNFTYEYTPVSLALDIKPGSCRNPLNPKSMGVLPVALLGTGITPVDDVDVSTLRLAGVAPLRSHSDDVSGPGEDGGCACPVDGADGLADLVLHFETSEIVAALGPVSAGDSRVLALSGELWDGTPFTTSDCIVIVGRGPAHAAGADGTFVISR